MFLFRSLRAKTLLWALVPLVLILVAVALIGRYAYEQSARDTVTQRDTELARVSAARLAEGLDTHRNALQLLAAEPGIKSFDPLRLEAALEEHQDSLTSFGIGIIVFDRGGAVVWPEDSSEISPVFLAPTQLDAVRRTLRPAFSDVFKLEISGADAVMVSVPILGERNQFNGVLSGVSNIRTSLLGATFAEVLELKAGRSGFAYLVDSQGTVVYHRDTSRLGTDLTSIAPVIRAIGGETGAIIADDPSGKEVVSGFAPVPGTGWALVTQERWSKVIGPIENRSVWLLLLLIAGGLISGALIFFTVGRTLRPIKQLIHAARSIAEGEFDHPVSTGSGDEIQILATQFSNMAGALKESYADLEQRVEARTLELAESEEQYRTLFEDSSDAIFVTKHGEMVAVNQAALDLFEFSLEEAIGSNTADRYVDAADQTRFREEIARLGSVREFEVKLLKNDGTVMDCLVTASRRLAADGSDSGEIQGIVRDITEGKQAAEAALQQTREVAVLEERNRMAREIHDTMAQGFTGIVLQLEAAEQTMEEGPSEIGHHLGRAKSLAREGLQEARRSVWGLLPHALEQLPLDDALEGEIKRFDTDGTVKTAFTLSGKRRELPTEIQTVLFRICQESLANVNRHAGATEVKVNLKYDSKQVRLIVQDNGVGFDPDDVHNGDRRSFGLIGMEQRAQGVEGSLDIKSGKGQGTSVEVVIPTP